MIFALLRLAMRIPGAPSLARWFAHRAVRTAVADNDPNRRRHYMAAQFELMGIPPRAGAAVSESLAAGITIAAGMAPNGRPFSLFLVAPELPHAQRRQVYDEIATQIQSAIAQTIDVPR